MRIAKTRDVLGFGCATVDELLYVDRWPDRDQKTPIRRLETQGGGGGATALVAAARIGARCSYAGMLGHDPASRRVVETFEAEEIDLSLALRHEEAGAIRSIIVVDTTNNTQNIFYQHPPLVGTPRSTPSEHEIAASRCIFIDHYGGAGNVRLCELAQRHQVPVVADFERTEVDGFESFFPLVDHLILSYPFAARLTNETNPNAAVRALWNEHRKVVVVTQGKEGAFTSIDGSEVTHFPAYPTKVVDTTGCGDCFHGVYCATLAWEYSLERRMKWANAAASLKASAVGAQKGLPNREAVENLLRQKVNINL